LSAWFISCDDGGTEPDDDNGDNDTSSTSLVIDHWAPENGAVEVPLGATLFVRICDTAETTVGVNPDSVFFFVDGDSVTFASINNTCGAVDLRYITPVPFDFGTLVRASISVQDNEGRWLKDSISFTTKLSWDTTEYSIDTLPPLQGFAVRSRPVGSYSDQASYFASTESGTYTIMPGGAPYSLSFSPGRSFILNDIDANIWTYNPELGIQTQITFDSSPEKYPALSPNGHTLAFGRDGDIVLLNLADDSEDILTSTSQGGRDFAFSPDSQYLAYRSGSGSMNPKIFIWDLEEREDIAHPILYNEVDCFDWSLTGSEIAVITNEQLYYWRVGTGFPSRLYQATNLKHVNFGTNHIYFVNSTPTGDIIMRMTTTPSTPETIIDLTAEAGVVFALAVNPSDELIYAKESGGTYTIEQFKVEDSSSRTLTSDIGQVRQIAWY
ncbi:MAG: TolB family protein, partial [bacterium]